jgi:putative peptidoglycan lipid II flippase
MSVSAAELPAMSGIASADPASIEAVRVRLDAGLRRIAFFVVPSAVAFLALGDVVVGALFQTGRFNHSDSIYVWRILAGSSVGLLASTLARLYSSTYYAFRDTRTPLRYAVIRVALTTILGYGFAIPLPRLLGIAPEWGAAGLTASAGIAGWVGCAAALDTERADWKDRLAASYVAQLWDRRLAPRSHGASRSRYRRSIRSRPPCLLDMRRHLPRDGWRSGSRRPRRLWRA